MARSHRQKLRPHSRQSKSRHDPLPPPPPPPPPPLPPPPLPSPSFASYAASVSGRSLNRFCSCFRASSCNNRRKDDRLNVLQCSAQTAPAALCFYRMRLCQQLCRGFDADSMSVPLLDAVWRGKTHPLAVSASEWVAKAALLALLWRLRCTFGLYLSLRWAHTGAAATDLPKHRRSAAQRLRRP